MKKNSLLLLLVIVLIGLSCVKDPVYEELTNSRENVLLGIPTARGLDTIQYFNRTTTTDTLNFIVSYGGLQLPSDDINVRFSTGDQMSLDSLNAIQVLLQKPFFQILPDSTYSIESLNLTINSGEVLSNIGKVVYFPDKIDRSVVNYILPLSIEDASGYDVNNDLRTLLYQFPSPNYDITRLREVLNRSIINFEAASFTNSLGTRSINSLDESAFFRASGLINGNLFFGWKPRDPGYPFQLDLDFKLNQDSILVSRFELFRARTIEDSTPIKFRILKQQFTTSGFFSSQVVTSEEALTPLIEFDPSKEESIVFSITPTVLYSEDASSMQRLVFSIEDGPLSPNRPCFGELDIYTLIEEE